MTRTAVTHTRTPGAVAHTRSWPVPLPAAGGVTIHCLSDMHAGLTLQSKIDNTVQDILTGLLVPVPVARVITGDVTNVGGAGEIVTAQTAIAAVSSVPVYPVMGNHDLFSGGTQATFGTAYATPSGTANYIVDLPTLRLIMIAPDALPTDGVDGADGARIRLPDATVSTWLDAQLAGTTKDCLIFCHAPLKDTVLGAGVNYDSSVEPWFVTTVSTKTTSNAILTVLAAHSNAKAWISGHVHCPINTPQFVVGQTVGSHTMAMISVSALAYTGINVNTVTQAMSSACTGSYVTYYPDRIEVRFRNHGGRVWDHNGTSRLVTVTL